MHWFGLNIYSYLGKIKETFRTNIEFYTRFDSVDICLVIKSLIDILSYLQNLFKICQIVYNNRKKMSIFTAFF